MYVIKCAHLARLVPGKKHELAPVVFLEPVEDASRPMLPCVSDPPTEGGEMNAGGRHQRGAGPSL